MDSAHGDRLIARFGAAMAAGLCMYALPAFSESAAPGGPAALPIDTPTVVRGIEVACTGVGQTRGEARWRGYGVRIEFSNARNEYLTGGAIVVRDAAGHELMNVSCDAPWILLRLPKGAYRVEGRLLDSAAKPRSAPFAPPASGQSRVVLQFPDA